MSRDENHKKLTEDMPLGARIGMNIMLAVAPPTLRRHAIRRLEAGPGPIRKTRAERQREWEIEQARRAREGLPRSDWTPQSDAPCPWDEEEGSESDSEARGVGALGADEKQVKSEGVPATEPTRNSSRRPRSSQPPEFTRESSQNPPGEQMHKGRRSNRDLTQQGGNKKEGRDRPSRTVRKLPASKEPGYFPHAQPNLASMTTGYQRIYRWSSEVDGVPEDLLPFYEGRDSVSTDWPGPRTDAADEVGPNESISVSGVEAEDQGLYRRGKIVPSSREGVGQSESTKWSQSSAPRQS